jgi:hypothetical protein
MRIRSAALEFRDQVLWSTRAMRDYVGVEMSAGGNFRCFAARRTSSRLRRCPFNFALLGFDLPPVGQVTATATVELHRNVIATSWAGTVVVGFGFHRMRVSFKEFGLTMAKSPRHRAMRIRRKFKSRLFGVTGSFIIFGIVSSSDAELLRPQSN